MRKLATLTCLLLVASFASAQTATYFKGTLDEAIAQAKKDGKSVLIEFFQKGG